MPTAGVTHDITLEEADSRNRRGYMLVRNRRGQRSWEIRDGQTIAPRQLTMGELSQAEFPAELELIWYQDNWQGGIGGVNHKLHPTKLASGLKVDATDYGVLRLGRELSLGQFAHGQLPGSDGLPVPDLPTPLAPPVADEHVPPLVPAVRFLDGYVVSYAGCRHSGAMQFSRAFVIWVSQRGLRHRGQGAILPSHFTA